MTSPASPHTPTRRSMLRAAGVALALPVMDALLPRSARGAEAQPPARLVAICATLGIHGPHLFPAQFGPEHGPTPYLDQLKAHRGHYTLLSGLSHPDQAGADGHSSEATWLTAARRPGLGGFRNSISMDQLIAEQLGVQTRFPSLVLSTSWNSQSYTRSGVMIPADPRPSQVFKRLFLDGTPQEVKAQVRRLREGRSIMDTVGEQARLTSARVGAADRARLEEYFTGVRDMERRLAASEAWVTRPKPHVDAKPPTDIANESDLIGRMKLLMDLIPLALQTDSTRVITVMVQGRNDVPPVPGVSIDHHNLSHHGQDPEKVRQLDLVEREEFKALDQLLTGLRARAEAGGTLLDRTTVVFGSNLGNANSHDTRNLPILLAGGGFRHAGHLDARPNAAKDPKANRPLSNLYVALLQRMGLEIDHFGSSDGAGIPGLSAA